MMEAVVPVGVYSNGWTEAPEDEKARFGLDISRRVRIGIFQASQLTAALGLGADIMRRASFLTWLYNCRDCWTDLPTPFHVIEGAD